MANLLIIGAGGVGRVATLKCLRSGVFNSVTLASRRLSGSTAIARDYDAENGTPLFTLELDASDKMEVVRAIDRLNIDIVLNVALPYQNMAIMEACAATKSHYIDTAVPESPERLYTATGDEDWYGPQWELHRRFSDAGITAVLGAGSDPGMVNAFCAYAAEELLDRIETIDIYDVNDGDHGHLFATNFNPEINLREVQAPAHYFETGIWMEVPALSTGKSIKLPEVGSHDVFLMDHDELHSLCRHFQDAHHIKFWMAFSENYRNYFNVLNNLGLLSHEPIDCPVNDGNETVPVVPLKLIRELLPDPPSLAENYVGKTFIGCHISGVKGGVAREYLIYNICDHEESYRDVGAQAISFTAGVCAASVAVLLANQTWRFCGVFNVEELPARPFLHCMKELGMGWTVSEGSIR